MSTSDAAASDAAPGAKPAKSWWDTIVTSTPVVMTVIATVLAGLSSGEMGRAQYYRSIAAQMQAKVSDQWNFFQAKRLRASAAENTLKLPLLMRQPVARAFSAADLKRDVARTVDKVKQAGKVLEGARGGMKASGSGAAARVESADRLGKALAVALRDATALQAQLEKDLAGDGMAETLSFLSSGELPHVEEKPIATAEIREAMKAVESPSARPESAALLNKITNDDLAAAMRTSDVNAAAFDAAAKPPGKAAEHLQQLLGKFVAVMVALDRAADESQFEFNGDDTPAVMSGLRSASEATRPAVEQATRIAADLTAAALRYDAARYEREATINLTTARLYEIQVRKATLSSERHLTRSYYFFYGMLGAQAAVTLASLALAVKERSVFWSIATAVGTGAIAYGGYVYLFK